jgi:hypothetical protein
MMKLISRPQMVLVALALVGPLLLLQCAAQCFTTTTVLFEQVDVTSGGPGKVGDDSRLHKVQSL